MAKDTTVTDSDRNEAIFQAVVYHSATKAQEAKRWHIRHSRVTVIVDRIAAKRARALIVAGLAYPALAGYGKGGQRSYDVCRPRENDVPEVLHQHLSFCEAWRKVDQINQDATRPG